jgi:hypothetical protein
VNVLFTLLWLPSCIHGLTMSNYFSIQIQRLHASLNLAQCRFMNVHGLRLNVQLHVQLLSVNVLLGVQCTSPIVHDSFFFFLSETEN